MKTRRHPHRIIALALAIGLTFLAPMPPLAGRAAPASITRVTLVAVVRPDDDPTLVEDVTHGLHQARAAFGARMTATVLLMRPEPSDLEFPERFLPRLVEPLSRAAGSSDLVIAWGDLLTGTALEMARRHPTVRFALVSSICVPRVPPNLTEASFGEGARAFLAGATAALKSRSHRIGFIGPLNVQPHIQVPEAAYLAGAQYADSRVRVFVDHLEFISITFAPNAQRLPQSWLDARFAGDSEPGYHDPRKAEEVAFAQFDRGADVVFAAAGASDAGVYQAAALRAGWVIGTGGDHTARRFPGAWHRHLLAVATDRPEAAVYDLVARAVGAPAPAPHTFPGHIVWGIAASPVPAPAFVGIALVRPASADSNRIARALTRIMDGIRRGEITVPGARSPDQWPSCGAGR